MRSSIGYSDFGEILEDGRIWVDKTLMIEDVLHDAKILIFTRPRRFGKTLNLSMLHHFFAEQVMDRKTAAMFTDMKISQDAESMAHQGQYPVIFLSLKGIKEQTFKKVYGKLSELISDVYKTHRYLLESAALYDEEKIIFQKALSGQADDIQLQGSIKQLSEYLYRHYKKRAVILIDEYDTPIHSAYVHGYYDDMIDFMRSFFESSLKDNSNIFKAVVTGILRVAKENLFSGLNNPEVYSMLDSGYGQYFGFTDTEVNTLFHEARITHDREAIKAWYNGYQIGGATVYNPWSILKCIKSGGQLASYWVNTSRNDLVAKMLLESDGTVKRDFDALLRNEKIRGSINSNLIFSDLKGNRTAVLTILLMLGYLKVTELIKQSGGERDCYLTLPNHETKDLFAQIAIRWIVRDQGMGKFDALLLSLLQGDMATFTKGFKQLVLDFFSVHDVAKNKQKNFYHGFTSELLATLQDDHIITSNHEAGFGRYDIALIPRAPSKNQLAILFEFKSVQSADSNEVKQAASKALTQIDQKRYTNELAKHTVSGILNIGVAFSGKDIELEYKRA